MKINAVSQGIEKIKKDVLNRFGAIQKEIIELYK
jgi:hypothetical protein